MLNKEEARKQINELKEMLLLVKSFNTTTNKKAAHETQLYNLQKIFYKCTDINHVYDPEYDSAFYDYKIAVKSESQKKELDHKLNFCKIHLYNNICSHIGELENMFN